LIKIGARVVRHARAITFQLAEVAVTGTMVRAILAAIHAQTERKRQHRYVRCPEKRRYRARMLRVHRMIRRSPSVWATTDTAQGEKCLFNRENQAILTTVGRPLGECRSRTLAKMHPNGSSAGIKMLKDRHEKNFLKSSKRHVSGLFWVSPSAVCLLALIPPLLAFFFPAQAYEKYIGEPYIFSRSPLTLFFYIICIMALFMGSRISFSLRKPQLAEFEGVVSRRGYLSFMMSVVSLIFLLNIYSFSIIIENSPNLFSLLFSGDGSSIKNEINTAGALTQAQPMLIATLVWFYFRFLQVKSAISEVERRTLAITLACGIVLSISLSTIKMARYELMPLIIQMFTVYFLYSALSESSSSIKRALRLLITVFGLAFVFFAFSYFRNSDSNVTALTPFIGYSVAPFNRLAYLIEGQLVYSYGGTGVYAAPFLNHVPLLHNVLDIGAFVGMPDLEVAFQQEFVDVDNAGLARQYIWPTAPGYIYSDFGVLCFIFIFFVGVLWRQSWNGLLAGNTVGMIMYTFLATSILLWFTANWAMRPALMSYLIGAIFISLAEHSFFGKRLFRPS